ncbi:MAG: hypothetical protein PHN69_00640 [Candidatus Pacebacteria bacterium]|nr:hypothetical protein [Candidatus Paceibacterota bacterium]
MEKPPLHLKIPELQTSEEVEDAVEKQERLTDESIPNDPKERLEAYMDRLEKVFLNPDERIRERNLEMLRPAIYEAFIIKPENVPESYFDLQKQVARERGQIVEEITPEMREKMIGVIIEDQKASLDSWINYLTSEDAVYPTWFKYFAFRNIVKLSQFDKTLGKFKSRTDTTTAPFPDIYREPLAQICDLYQKVEKDNKTLKDPEIQKAFSQKFPTYYAELITKSLASKIENREEIKGQWVKYNQGSNEDAEKLYKSLESKGTGWCTAGMSTAQAQIESGDFYVYYTEVGGEATQPRIAIRMNGNNEIGEVRGILEHQNLEQQMSPILEEKLKDFGPEADKYKKKSADMKLLTEIDQKTQKGEVFTKEDLQFLYEVNSNIEGFGYEKDPRIEEIRSKRNLQEDLLILFDCRPEQIALKKEDIKPDTLVYIGEWTPEVMNLLPETIKYIYESFPDKKVFKRTIETYPNIDSPEKAKQALLDKGFKLYGKAEEILQKVSFNKERKEYNLVSFSVKSLGFPNGATTKEIYDKAEEMGLELCPAEVGPLLRLNYLDQPNGEYLRVTMKTIEGSGGRVRLFTVDHGVGERSLNTDWDNPGNRWNAGNRFVFLSRKS